MRELEMMTKNQKLCEELKARLLRMKKNKCLDVSANVRIEDFKGKQSDFLEELKLYGLKGSPQYCVIVRLAE